MSERLRDRIEDLEEQLQEARDDNAKLIRQINEATDQVSDLTDLLQEWLDLHAAQNRRRAILST